MNKLLVRVYLFLLIMFALAIVQVGSLHSQILTTGQAWGFQVIENSELHVFYQSLNEILRTRFITEYYDYDELMKSDIDKLVSEYNLGTTMELVAVYDDKLHFVKGSTKTALDRDARHMSDSVTEKYVRVLFPPRRITDLLNIKCTTADGHNMIFVLDPSERARITLNDYAANTYRLSIFSIIISILIAFMPIGVYFYFNYIRPLDKLQSAANQIAEGNLNVTIDERGLYEIKEFSKSFENMRHELEESKRRVQVVLENRQQLITNISHDLRTPITSISGYVEGLLDGKGENPERMDRYLRTIKSKTEYLNAMINDLFLFSQLDMDGYSLELSYCNSREMLEKQLQPMELWLENSGFELEVVRPFPSVPIRVDYMRMTQVFENIVQNSIKYATEHGKLKIDSYIKNHHLVIDFTDNGIGIAPESIPHIFDAFYREDKSRTQSKGGAGLGLSICKKIVELHGGIIKVSSEIGEGTKLRVYLPLSPIENH